MAGPFPLSTKAVRDHTYQGDRPGVYLLRKSRDGPVRYVGRSDTNIRRRLLTRARENTYHYFTVEHKDTPREAWIREANLFHYHKADLTNKAHPNPPDGLSCPGCSRYDH